MRHPSIILYYLAAVIHNYRWRLGLDEGESKYDDLEKLLAASSVSLFQLLPLKVIPTVLHTQIPVPMPANLPANINTEISKAASITICLKGPHMHVRWL